jgi:drug/metabolite transporter (DMT)-like permease
MIGTILGLLSAALFGISMVIIRRGVLKISPNYIAMISIFTGPPFLLLISSITGDITELSCLGWKDYIFLALSGITHFAIGRTWAYKSIQIIGSNRSNIVITLTPLISVILAIILLKETITPLIFFGIIISLSGPLLIVLKEQEKENNQFKDISRHTLYTGMIYGLGAATFWGSSNVFVKLGLENSGSPIAGSLIAYTAASFAISPSLFIDGENKREILNKDKKHLKLASLIGIATCMAHLLRYLALGYGSVIVISLMLRTQSIWILLFSFIFNRKYESFSIWVILANALVIIGTILILIPSG